MCVRHGVYSRVAGGYSTEPFGVARGQLEDRDAPAERRSLLCFDAEAFVPWACPGDSLDCTRVVGVLCLAAWDRLLEAAGTAKVDTCGRGRSLEDGRANPFRAGVGLASWKSGGGLAW